MNRRGFLAAISCLPFLGFLKPEPEYVMRPEDWKAGYMVAAGEPRLTDPNDYYVVNSKKMKDSLVWFDEEIRDWKVVTGRAEIPIE